MRLTDKILIFIGVGIVCAGIYTAQQYSGYKDSQENDVFAGNIELCVNGEPVYAAGMTAEAAYLEYVKNHSSRVVDVHLNGKTKEIDISPYCTHSIRKEDFTEASRQGFIDYLLRTKQFRGLTDQFTYNGGAEQSFDDVLRSETYVKSVDAYVDPGTIEVVPEVYGDEIDPEKAAHVFKAAVAEKTDKVYLDSEQYYIKPAVHEDEIRKLYKPLLDKMDWHVSYPEYDTEIRLSDHKDSISVLENGKYEIDDSFLKDEVLELSKKVDIPYKEVEFTKHSGETTIIAGGTYGPVMSNAEETKDLKKMLKENVSEDCRVPVWKTPPNDGTLKTYIEVDIENQHVYHYVDGELHCDSPCVTGNENLGRGTPRGAFFISEKVPGKTLVGRNNSYRTWVNRWMRVTNDGVGLHDAGWRGSFGGSIYLSNGSHGCINLPPDYAYKLYDEISAGIPVFIY